ncbi:MAG: adenosylcobinamide-GDP ribazoletransferase [Gammaproteobacteria bacterium]|nr:adenosylcobinamide-GDP ribazoletransferase [Gammaproteobacteria bacterium]
MLRPFLIALQFLTALPIRLADPPDAEATGRSLLYYPLVGLLIGALLAGLAWLLSGTPTLVAAALLLAVWVAVSGALHLDGLADSADAWLGGLGDRERTLAIMKDPYCGPAGVVTLVLVLLLKFAALAYLVPNGDWEILVVTPVLGRTALVLLFLTTPYVRPHGLGSLLADHLPRRACIVIVIFTLAAVPLIIGTASIMLLLVMAGVFLLLRRLMLRRLGGTTGDTAGALIEVTEATVLLAAVLMS